MRRLINIALSMVVAIAATLVVSCNNETDTTLTSQQSSIEKYLTGSHSPKLIPESELGTSLDEHPEYYTNWGLDIFRYITNMYDEGRDEKPIAEIGDDLSITYTAYIFKSGKPTSKDIFATNDAESIKMLQELGLNTEYEWSDEPKVVQLGNDKDLFDSLSTALEGCHEGDKVEIYLTFEAAYGKHHIGMVPSKSAQMWEITINQITKR